MTNKILEGMARHDMAFAQGMISAAQHLAYFIRDDEGCRLLNKIYERASAMRLEGRAALRQAAGGGDE